MIPEFDDGVLPEGVHSCTLDEVEQVFGRFTRSDCRQRLTQTLRRYIEDVRKARIAVAVIVDGSYITAKSEPNDIDLVLALRPDVDMSADVRPMESMSSQREWSGDSTDSTYLPQSMGASHTRSGSSSFRTCGVTTENKQPKGPQVAAKGRAMIENDEQLEQTRGAISHLEAGLAALKRDVLPINRARFALMAEPVVSHIRALRAQVEDYVGVTSATSEEAEVWMRLQGPEIELGDAPTSVVTTMLELLRRGVQSVAEFLQRGAVGARPTSDMKQACDLRIVAWMPGSVQVGLRLPEIVATGPEESGLSKQARLALKLYLETATWVGSEEDSAFLEQAIPSAAQRRLLLNQVARLVPRPRGATDLVELSGRELPRGPVRLRRESSARVRQAISTIVREELATAHGLLREIDLDQRSFTVRTPDGAGMETKCEIEADADDLMEIAKDGLDHPVIVRGTRRTDPTRRKVHPLQVLEIEVLDKAADEIPNAN